MHSLTSKTWILGSFRKDFIFFYFPGLLVAIYLFLFSLPKNEDVFLIMAFVCFGIFDSGHVYTSVWRTYLDKEEFSRRKVTYILSPLVLFFIFYIMTSYSFFLLGAVVLYATIYHNMRQFYGLTKWYQKINLSFDKTSDKFFYALCILPFITIHFRTGVDYTEYYAGANILFSPNEFIEKILTFSYFLLLLFWCCYEFYKARKVQTIEWARILSVALPAGLYGLCFLYFSTVATVSFPLVVSHGLSYMVLVWFAEKKLRKEKILTWALPAMIFLVALLFGGFELFLDEFRGEGVSSFWSSFIAAALLTPLFCHYYFDAFLWKSDHPDFSKIVS